MICYDYRTNYIYRKYIYLTDSMPILPNRSTYIKRMICLTIKKCLKQILSKTVKNVQIDPQQQRYRRKS